MLASGDNFSTVPILVRAAADTCVLSSPAAGPPLEMGKVPLWLATAHSAGAAFLLMATVALNRSLRAPA